MKTQPVGVVLAILAAALGLSGWCLAGNEPTEPAPTQGNATNLTFREPFTLRIRADKDSVYEERFERKIPFVADNDVYLFCGESFGLSLGVASGEVASVAYQPNKEQADIELELTQEIGPNGEPLTMLVLKSNVPQTLYLDALMTLPERKEIFHTTILPLQPGMSGYESWPHPIVQLVLRNLRFKESPPNAPEADRVPAN